MFNDLNDMIWPIIRLFQFQPSNCQLISAKISFGFWKFLADYCIAYFIPRSLYHSAHSFPTLYPSDSPKINAQIILSITITSAILLTPHSNRSLRFAQSVPTPTAHGTTITMVMIIKPTKVAILCKIAMLTPLHSLYLSTIPMHHSAILI